MLRDEGHEFGATTGRPRRCGWFDAVVAKYAIGINGIDALVLTKIDVLDKFENIKVCTGYKHKGEVHEEMPADLDCLQHCEPVYTEFEGWQTNTVGITSYDELPEKARQYIESLGRLLETKFLMISTGPERNYTIHNGKLFES